MPINLHFPIGGQAVPAGSIPYQGSYEHEALHLYGALDEYSGSSYCGQTSILAVDPMDYLYSNTNHITCSGSTNSVMRDPYSTSTISQSAGNSLDGATMIQMEYLTRWTALHKFFFPSMKRLLPLLFGIVILIPAICPRLPVGDPGIITHNEAIRLEISSHQRRNFLDRRYAPAYRGHRECQRSTRDQVHPRNIGYGYY